ncbi:hypothetical protein HDU91_005121 [Kappamyces sp. JEL0680]|nr:hypothetical protein HDU91_005121 [Kappamyces sp. JEL0680]
MGRQLGLGNSQASLVCAYLQTHQPDQLQATLRHSWGCVNALTTTTTCFATGGDDLRVLLYPSWEDATATVPSAYLGHESNIFCIQITQQKDQAWSVGNDGFLVHHDLSRPNQIGKIRLAHYDACLKVSLQPSASSVLLTAGMDYTLKLWDARVPNYVAQLKRRGTRNNYVEFHPHRSELFCTSDDRGGIHLWDIRNWCEGKALTSFTTSLAKDSFVSRPPDITSAKFSPDGQFIGASIQKYKPVIYSISDPHPVALLDGYGYSSLATIKNGDFSNSFGGNLLFFSGSDNGTTYGWELPPLQEMLDARELGGEAEKHHVCFISDPIVESSTPPLRIQPMRIQQKYKLKGSVSVVNSICCHPTLPFVMTAGIEKAVRIYGPSPIPNLEPETEPNPRTLEDEDTIEMFQRLVQEEQATVDRYFWRRPHRYQLNEALERALAAIVAYPHESSEEDTNAEQSDTSTLNSAQRDDLDDPEEDPSPFLQN